MIEFNQNEMSDLGLGLYLGANIELRVFADFKKNMLIGYLSIFLILTQIFKICHVCAQLTILSFMFLIP